MWLILFFRVCLLSGFLFAVWKWGDWKNWPKYYPTVLFVMVVNLAVSFLTYHHALWYYNPDALVKTQTTVELLNSFVMLPTTAFIYISKFPISSKFHQYSYMVLWILMYSILEYIDNILGGISYKNGWSWSISTIFDIALFSIVRLHYLKPFWAWLSTILLTIVILVLFNFGSGEFK